MLKELTNDISKLQDRAGQGLAVEHEALTAAVQLLAPIVPHLGHELWQALGGQQAIIDTPWPQFDEEALVRSSIEIVVQVNGKVRAKLSVPADADADTIKTMAKDLENVQKFIDGKAIRKEIVVPGKLVNIVAA